MEIMVIVVIVGVLAVLGVYSSQSFFENAKDKSCRANLMVLKQAMDFYMLDHEVFPNPFVKIPQKYIDRAYACVLPEDHSWQAKLSSFIESWQKSGLVYAQHFINSFSPNNMEVLSCPKDPNPPSLGAGEISYGINFALAGMSIRDYQNINIVPNATLIIGDCEAATFGNLEPRHGQAPGYALAIQKDDTIVQQ